jgi:ApaG protein
MSTSEAVTQGVRVSVEARYSPEHSDPPHDLWFFLYTITITNEGDRPVHLRSRHWIITDATGRIEEVRGPGVVGEQPVLQPGASFEYTSGCPLPTPYGSMRGSYDMAVVGGGEPFQAEVAEFMLREPGAIH